MRNKAIIPSRDDLAASGLAARIYVGTYVNLSAPARLTLFDMGLLASLNLVVTLLSAGPTDFSHTERVLFTGMAGSLDSLGIALVL